MSVHGKHPRSPTPSEDGWSAMTTAVNPAPAPHLKRKLVVCFPTLGREPARGLQKQRGYTTLESATSWGDKQSVVMTLAKAVLFSNCVFPLLVLQAITLRTVTLMPCSHSSLGLIILRRQSGKRPCAIIPRRPHHGAMTTANLLSEKQHPLGQLLGTGTELGTTLSDLEKGVSRALDCLTCWSRGFGCSSRQKRVSGKQVRAPRRRLNSTV